VSDESIPLSLPLPRLLFESNEVTALFREQRKALLRYIVCLGLSKDEAQDVVQDAFVSLQRHLASGGRRENLRGWLFRVAHNSARNRQTSYDRRFAEPLDGQMDFLTDEATPEERMLAKERSERLATAIGLLTEAERDCLLLRANGLRYREIGEVLGIATSTVGDIVERAIRKLAERCNV
jgi:RNA polymerase sigma-70 factor (ECF subfamily)